MEFQTLIDALSGFGVTGLFIALLVLVAVFVAKRAGLVATGDQARLANLALSAILAGLSTDPAAEKALMAALASLLAALAYEAIKYIANRATIKG